MECPGVCYLSQLRPHRDTLPKAIMKSSSGSVKKSHVPSQVHTYLHRRRFTGKYVRT